MTTVSTWAFDDPDGAGRALRRLERLEVRELVVVEDASVVSWPAGRPRSRTHQAGAVTGTAGLSGAFWGLLSGVLFLLPLADVLGGTSPGPLPAVLSGDEQAALHRAFAGSDPHP